ncbi:MAG: extracellular solute-binding protein, partial [Rhodoglobus sp.]
AFDISDHFGNAVGSWASKGLLEPLDDYIAAEGIDTSDFVPAALDQMTYDGKIYSLPIAVHSFQLLYNKTLLEEAGVAVPTTIDELAVTIEALTKQGADGTITQLGLGDPSPSTTITTLGYAFGGNWDAGGKPSPTEAGNVEALQWYQDAITNKFGASNIATFNSGLGEYMSPQDPFYVGKTAMVIDGEWRALNIPNTAPDLDWGVTSIPYVTTDLEDTTQLTASTLFIPANSKHKEAAATFLAYLVSDEGMTAFSLALGNLPSRTSLLDSAAYDGIENFSVWLDALKSDNVFALSSKPYAAEYSTDLGVAFDEVIRGANSPQDALDAVLNRSSGYATE